MTMDLRAFSPPTLDTFAAHWRHCAYKEARNAIRALRTAGCHRQVWLAMGRAEAAVSILYDLDHPQAHMILCHVRGARNAVDRYLEKRKRST